MVALALDPDAVIRGPDLAPPAEGLYALLPLVLLLLLLTVVVLIRRRRERLCARRRQVGFMANFGLSAALGNALAEMNALLDPSRPAVMATEHETEEGRDRLGDGRMPPIRPDLPREPPGVHPRGCLPQPGTTLNWVCPTSSSPPKATH